MSAGACARSKARGSSGAHILGLYTGGTLAYETEHVLRGAFGDGYPHRILDLGDDEYTVGRPHPMIDPRTRGEMIVRAGDDPQVGVLLVDVVLGKGAHESPAAPLVEAVNEARRIARAGGREIAVLASRDRHGRRPAGLRIADRPAGRAGIATLATNADAAWCAAMLVRPQPRPRLDAEGGVMETKVLPELLPATDIGLESFADDLRTEGVPVVQLDWRPPAGGNARLAALLAELDDEE